jgi:hypothetical protein
VPEEVTRARILEAYLMVAGLIEESLARQIGERVLAIGEQPAWMGTDRRALAVGRALLAAGRTGEALRTLEAIPAGAGLGQEAARVRAEALLGLGEPLSALRVLAAAGGSAGRGEGQGIWQAVTGALTRISEANPTCETCPLLNSEFCVSAEGFWAFVEQNPFNEPRRSLRHRIEKRGRHGLEVDGPHRMLSLIERFGGRWDDALMARWIERAPAGRPEEWLNLAQRLVDEGTPALALRAAERAQAGGEEPRLMLGVSRVRLAAADLAGGIELARRVEEGGVGWDAAMFGRELELRLGKQWESRVDALVAELPEESATFLRRLAESSRARAALQAQRQRLEAALKAASWREVKEALAGLKELLGDGTERDGQVKEAQSRLVERERRVQQRVEQLTGAPLQGTGPRAELTRLAEEAELFGLVESATKAREALAAAPPSPPAPEARAASPGGHGRPELHGQEGRRPDVGGARPPREGRAGGAARPARPGEAHAARPAGEGRPGRQPEARPARAEGEVRQGAPRVAPQRADGGGRASQRPESGARPQGEPRAPRERQHQVSQGPIEEPVLLQAVKEARGDRERVSLVMPAVYDLLAREPERGIKLLRDALPLFQFQGALDRPMAEVIREGRPEDGALPRLRRVLEKENGRFFTAALSELSSREHPEPWKRVLGQLKLKG